MNNQYKPADANNGVESQAKCLESKARLGKLKAKWTPEMAQDITAFHSINVAHELAKL